MQQINSEEEFKQALKSEVPVIIDFYATWCAPCKQLATALETLSGKWEDSIKVYSVNIEKNMKLAVNYKISSVPTIIVFVNEKPTKTVLGFSGIEELEKLFQQFSK